MSWLDVLRRCRALVLGLGLVTPLHAQAVIDVPRNAPWALRTWDTRNGLPQNTVTTLLQTSDRMLWVGTFGGLCRYDGVAWTVFDPSTLPGLPDSRVTAVLEDADGSLWIGTEKGFVLRLHDGVCTQVARRGDGVVSSLARLSDGRIVCGGLGDVVVVGRDGSMRPLLAKERLVRSWFLATAGDALFVGSEQGLVRIVGDRAERVVDGLVTALRSPGDGTVWAATGARLWHWDGTRAVARDELLGEPPLRGSIEAILVKGSGALWLGSQTELRRVHPDGEQTPRRFATTVPVRCLHGDASDGVWVGFVGAGLVRLVPCEVEGVELVDALGRLRAANVVLPDGDGAFFVGFPTGLLRFDGAGLTRVTAVPAVSIQALHGDADGTTWCGLDHAIGRLRAGVFEQFPAGQQIGPVRAITRDADGRLLVGAELGVFVFDGRFEPFAPAARFAGSAVKGLQRWPDGSLWLFGGRGALHLRRDGSQQWLRSGEDLPLDEVRAVLPGTTGRAWFATYGSGFVCRDGDRPRVVSVAEGLPDAYLCTAVPFGTQWLIGGNRGPFLVDPAQLDLHADGRQARVHARRLECTTGSPNEANGGLQPSSASHGDEAVVCSVGGLWSLSRRLLRVSAPPPLCVVHPVLRDDQRASTVDGEASITAVRNRTLVVDCTAAEFDRPENILFRWRFRGGDWSEPSPRRTLSIVLPGVGEHRLEFVAVDDEGRSSVEPCPLRVVVAPMWWEHPAFPWLALVAATAAGALFFRFGSQRTLRRARHLQQLVDSRTAELSQARDQLEERVAQRTAELQRALQQNEEEHAQRARLERQLEQMRRMESLGQLAGSVAHDFNNLLTVVLGNAQLLALTDGMAADARQLLQQIVEASLRGREMTQRLLAVASRQVIVPEVVDLGAVLRTQMRMLGDLLGAGVRIDLQVPDEPVWLRATPGQVEQILLNLAVNARDAMPGGGTFSVRCARAGETVRVEVGDDGEGMSAEVAGRAFEPFFTTRPGRGTGLGLATVYGITNQLGGEVQLSSEPGRGTRFLFTFPAAAEAARPAPVVALPRPPAGTGQRVLLVEDDAEVRRAMRALLEAWGCRIVGDVGSGEQALREVGENGLAVDVVVTDAKLPGLAGIDLVTALRAQRPGLPIVFVSGHTASSDLVPALAALGIELLAKPPVRAELLAAIDRAVQGAVRAT